MATEQLKKHRKYRLLQVFYLTEAVLLIELFHRLIAKGEAAIPLAIAIVFTMLVLSPVYFLATRLRLELATQWFLVALTLFVSALLWSFNGLTDEALFGYPCILVFSALMGLRRTFVALMVFMILNILLLGLANDLQWLQHPSTTTSLNSGILFCIILALLGISIWLQLGDLNQLLQALQSENNRVMQSQQQIEQLINHDALTHLPNRIVARQRFADACRNASVSKRMVAVMFIDLDNFKHVNDSLGHHVGDALLMAIAKQLQLNLRSRDTVCRISGDEFLVLAEGFQTQLEVKQLAEKLLEAVAAPVQIANTEISSTCSIGIALCPHDGDNFDTLCQKADMAMYQVKDSGRNSCSFFDIALSKQTEQTFNLLNDLKKALPEQQFELYYQPQYDLQTGQIFGAEALLRWHHPTRGMISPAVFIPLAEQSGMMADIGFWVLQQACHDCALWNQGLKWPIRVAVNVSQSQLSRRHLELDVQTALQESELSGNLLELELTETMLVENAGLLQRAIKVLKAKGVHFSLDDFGTGYSNLAYLQDFELGLLKIDQSFTQKLLTDDRSKAVVRAIIQLAASLELQCIAEGIENEQTLVLLTRLGCFKGQGYYWAKPEPLSEFQARLNGNPCR